MRAEKIETGAPLSRIVRMVLDAQRGRAPIQRMADQASGLVRAGGDRRRRGRLCCLGAGRPRAATLLRPG